MHALTHMAQRIGRSDKARHHAYTEFYGPFLEKRRLVIRNVLEIGICDGGSVLMWREFFPNAQIYAVDVREHVNVSLSDLKSDPNIHLYFQNAYNEKFTDKIKDIRFDLMIDDGPHTMPSWKYFLRHFHPMLSETGIMVIEDISTHKQIAELVETFEGDRFRFGSIEFQFGMGSSSDVGMLLIWK